MPVVVTPVVTTMRTKAPMLVAEAESVPDENLLGLRTRFSPSTTRGREHELLMANRDPKDSPVGALDGTVPRGVAASPPGDLLQATLASRPPGGGHATTSTSTVEEPSIRDWDRYELLELLGRGGMGVVWKARDRRLGRIVAVKLIRGADPNLAMRFVQEARAQARIDHPGICKVFEVGEVDGKRYIAMQFVDGQRLDKAAASASSRPSAHAPSWPRGASGACPRSAPR